jgi:hypothetical protein
MDGHSNRHSNRHSVPPAGGSGWLRGAPRQPEAIRHPATAATLGNLVQLYREVLGEDQAQQHPNGTGMAAPPDISCGTGVTSIDALAGCRELRALNMAYPELRGRQQDPPRPGGRRPRYSSARYYEKAQENTSRRRTDAWNAQRDLRGGRAQGHQYQASASGCSSPAPTRYTRVFVGRSPRNDMTEFSGGHGPPSSTAYCWRIKA